MMVESKLSLDFSNSSASIQLCSSTALVNERMRFPFWSSGVMTNTGIDFPTSRVSSISTGIASYSLPVIRPSDLVPTLTRIWPSEILAITPSRVSPRLGKSINRPSSFSKASILLPGCSCFFSSASPWSSLASFCSI